MLQLCFARRINTVQVMPTSISTFITVLGLIITVNNFLAVDGYYAQCPKELGGGYCPVGDTCCPRIIPNQYGNEPVNNNDSDEDDPERIVNGSYCIPYVLGMTNATCCSDDYDSYTTRIGQSGCPVGYTCNKTTIQQQQQQEEEYFCSATSSITDPILQKLPRYNLCSESIHGATQDSNGTIFGYYGYPLGIGKAVFPYYSSHGSITVDNNDNKWDNIKFVVIAIHGAQRNADDMHCSVLAAAATASLAANLNTDSNNILVISPRFTTTIDTDTTTTIILDNSTESVIEVVQWDPYFGGYGGSWRFGDTVVWPPYAVHISSYDIIDMIIQQIHNQCKNIQHISMYGHSAGGQFVQRWSVLTPIWETIKDRNNSILLTSVVANPSSFVYLTNKRFIVDTVSKNTNTSTIGDETSNWIVPNNTTITDCPEYNQWMYGLELPNENKISYVTNVLLNNTIEYIQQRYATRLIIYLSGLYDYCNTSKTTIDPWCNSHGLQTICADMLQGSNRLQRHDYFYNSLLMLYNNTNDYNNSTIKLHQYIDYVPEVGHDYSLMINSPVGIRATFDPLSYKLNNQYTMVSRSSGSISGTSDSMKDDTTIVSTVQFNEIKDDYEGLLLNQDNEHDTLKITRAQSTNVLLQSGDHGSSAKQQQLHQQYQSEKIKESAVESETNTIFSQQQQQQQQQREGPTISRQRTRIHSLYPFVNP